MQTLPPPSKGSKWAVGILVGFGILIVAIIVALFVIVIIAPSYWPKPPDTDRLVIITPIEHEKKVVTLAQYQLLKTGMTYQQVVGILGGKGVEISRNENGGGVTVIYKWEGDGIGANLNATLRDGQLIQKTQSGLK